MHFRNRKGKSKCWTPATLGKFLMKARARTHELRVFFLPFPHFFLFRTFWNPCPVVHSTGESLSTAIRKEKRKKAHPTQPSLAPWEAKKLRDIQKECGIEKSRLYRIILVATIEWELWRAAVEVFWGRKRRRQLTSRRIINKSWKRSCLHIENMLDILHSSKNLLQNCLSSLSSLFGCASPDALCQTFF